MIKRTQTRHQAAPSRQVRAWLVISTLMALIATSAPVNAQTPPRDNPRLQLMAPDGDVTMYRYGRGYPVPLSLGLMVAAVDAPFELRVRRPDYSGPLQLEQIARHGDVVQTRALDPALLDGWKGLRNFLNVTFHDEAGATVLSTSLTFCPNAWQRQRANDSGPPQPTFPPGCFSNPFTKGVVWGIDRGWATPTAGSYGSDAPLLQIPNGRYRVTATIDQTYVELFDLDPADVSVELMATVERLREDCSFDPGCVPEKPPRRRSAYSSSNPSAELTAAPTVENPDPAILPDLVALPSWGIRVENRRERSILSFGATVWLQGASDLVVEGFRRPGEAVMDAYQYFYRDGELVGKAPTGEFEFDTKDGHRHWHFQQFAQYALVDGDGGEVKPSRKEAFCLAATDAIDLTLPGARMNPEIGLATACGMEDSIWIRETLPLGWGDTYFQSLPGQSFNITDVPNGTYYIQVEANPSGALYEQTADNNVEMREVILKGKPGQRRVVVPPWNGIDSEAPPNPETIRAAEAQDGRIAFIRNHHNGLTDVVSVRPDGTGQVKITDTRRNELYVDTSPDGRRVAFTRFGRNGGEIFSAPIAGGRAKRLTSNKINDELPIWSPDSSKIAFVGFPKGESDGEIYVMNADGSGRTRVTTNRTGDADPRWSPDGTRLIYNGGNMDLDEQEVYLVSLGEPGALRLTEPGVNDTFAEWSPDGQAVVYSSYSDDQWDIYSVGVDGTGRTQLTDDPVDDYAARWSPDGSQILFVRGRLEGNLPPDEVYVMNADGTGERSVSPPRLRAFSPEWSPTGTKIAFIGQVDVRGEPLPEWEIFTVNADGTDLTRVTRTKSEEFDPEWTPRF